MDYKQIDKEFDEEVVYKNARRGTLESSAFIKETKSFYHTQIDKIVKRVRMEAEAETGVNNFGAFLKERDKLLEELRGEIIKSQKTEKDFEDKRSYGMGLVAGYNQGTNFVLSLLDRKRGDGRQV